MNAPKFADPYTSPGGKGLPYHASVRLRSSSIGVIKEKINGVEIPIGSKIKIKVRKNRVGPPLRECEIDLYFDSGIDDYSSWLGVMKDYKLCSQAGAWYSWTDEDTGEVIKFQSKDFVDKILSVQKYKDKIYSQICDKVIMSYKSFDELPEVRLDKITLSNELLDDE
jgi:recombination protein RecA